MRSWLRSFAVSIAAVAVIAVSACSGDGEPSGTRAAAVDRSEPVLTLPEQVLGLAVVPEEIELGSLRETYVDSLGLFSFRRDDDLLRATLQIGRFNEFARPEDRDFRRNVIANLGSTVPEELRVGNEEVYLTAGNEQYIFVWFDEEAFYVLSIRSDYEFPRMLLRRLLDTEIMG